MSTPATPAPSAADNNAPTPRTDASYVVTAYRWGQRNAHSYVVGAFADLNRAIRCAMEHVDYSGGKYACEVVEAGEWTEANDEAEPARQVHYIESPYYGLAHDSGHFHAADCNKRGHPSAKPFTVRELQNRVNELERELAAKDAEIAELKDKVVSAAWEYGKQKSRAEKAEAERDAIAKTADMRYRDLTRCQPIHEALVAERAQLRAEVERVSADCNRLKMGNAALYDERTKHIAQLAAAQRDTERMDWLAANSYNHKTCDCADPVFLSAHRDINIKDIRTAIDAARNSHSPTTPNTASS